MMVLMLIGLWYRYRRSGGGGDGDNAKLDVLRIHFFSFCCVVLVVGGDGWVQEWVTSLRQWGVLL